MPGRHGEPGHAQAGTIAIQVVQVASVQLERRAPQVLIGDIKHHSPDQMMVVDLEVNTPIAHNVDEEHETRGYLIENSLADLSCSQKSDTFVEIAARSSPSPHFILENTLPSTAFKVEFAVSRTIVTVKISNKTYAQARRS